MLHGNAVAAAKLWVTAVDIDAPAGRDPSHPAFYLDGQELEANNLRGFWVLDPCRQLGSDCTSGDQCCQGFCRAVDGGGMQCVLPPTGCSNEFEKCTTSSDCCDNSQLCIAERCALPPPK
jgi:hypothetical protein